MKVTEQKVLRFIKENNLIVESDRILIAISGGPDSVFLLHFLNKFRRKYKIDIAAVHINHLLRGKDSQRDELFCKAICDELSIPFFFHRVNVKKYAELNKFSLEVAGRKIRYQYFEKLLNRIDYTKVVTAHNSDDNLETVLLNLVKGTGIKGVAGIPVKRDKIIRPVLCLSKQEILDYLEENKFEYRVDLSNYSDEFERNYLRNNVIPLVQKNLNPSVKESVLNSSLNLQRFNLFIDEQLKKLKSIVKVEKDSQISFSLNDVIKIDEFLFAQLIKEVVDENFNSKTEFEDIKKVISLTKRQAGKTEELSNSLLAVREREVIIVRKNNNVTESISITLKVGDKVQVLNNKFSIEDIAKSKITIGKNKNIEFIAADKIKNDFIIRNWKAGDKFYPIGLRGTKKVSDYLTDAKIDLLERNKQLVLTNNGKIVWLIGKRLDDRYKITSQTKKVLKLCLN